MMGQRHLPPPPHQRVALVVHNPDHLLLGVPLWLPGMLLSEAVQLGAGPAAAAPPALAGRVQHAAAGVQSRKARGGGSGRRLLAAQAGAKATGAPLPPRLQLLALSPNVAAYTSSLVEAWAGSIFGASAQPSVPVPWLPPLVPWQSMAAGQAAAGQAGAAAADEELSSLVGLGAGGPNRPMQHLCIQVGAACCCSCCKLLLRRCYCCGLALLCRLLAWLLRGRCSAACTARPKVTMPTKPAWHYPLPLTPLFRVPSIPGGGTTTHSSRPPRTRRSWRRSVR